MKRNKKNVLKIVTVIVMLGMLVFFTVLIQYISEARDRDIVRITDINKLRTALQFYYLDNGHYPAEKQWCSLESNCDNLSKEIKPYLSEIPKDPLYSKDQDYSYLYKTTEDGSDYKIYTRLERGGSYELGSKRSFLIISPK